MFRASVRGLSISHLKSEWAVSAKPGTTFLTRIATRWRRLNTPTKMALFITSPVTMFAAYTGFSMAIYSYTFPRVNEQYKLNKGVPSEMISADHYQELEDWDTVRQTLQMGDVVLLMGTGSMSWKITNCQFALSGLRPSAMRYSHVAMVVRPYDKKTKKGPFCLEVVNNEDIKLPSYSLVGNVAVEGLPRTKCCQVVDINQRVLGKHVIPGHVHNNNNESNKDSPPQYQQCYQRLAVRRLKGFNWTKQRRHLLDQFVAANVGRPMDTSPLIMLTHIHPYLYTLAGVRSKKPELCTCSEVIADAYELLGITKRLGEEEERLAAAAVISELRMAMTRGDIVTADGITDYKEHHSKKKKLSANHHSEEIYSIVEGKEITDNDDNNSTASQPSASPCAGMFGEEQQEEQRAIILRQLRREFTYLDKWQLWSANTCDKEAEGGAMGPIADPCSTSSSVITPPTFTMNSSVKIVPAHFTASLDGPLKFSEGVCLGPEIRMPVVVEGVGARESAVV
eukprot:Tbor_TRINITY_DN5768_c0_g1::TRINITY_DN5768_c0_g1_i1::g.19561::m.19561